MPVIRLDRRTVGKLPVPAQACVYYDAALKGFGLRVAPSGVKTWFVEYRPGHGGRSVSKRKLSLGRDSEAFRADAARELAKKTLARVALGADPAEERNFVRRAETLAEVLQAYMDEKIRPKRKRGTAVLFDGYIRNHIVPHLGSKKAVAVTRADLVRLHARLGAEYPTTANRVLSLIATAFTWSERAGLAPDGFKNPARGIERFREAGRERFLTADELARLGATLRLAETDGLPWNPRPGKKVKHAPRPEHRRVIIDRFAVAAVRLLLFTGCRLREILHLEWAHVDLERGALFLPDSKTGAKTVILSGPALAVLTELPRESRFVIAGRTQILPDGTKVDRPRSDLNRPWARIIDHADLRPLRIHDLRHSFASVGVSSGLGLPVIGRLLGHADAATTARYAHLDADPLRRATDAISEAVQAALNRSAQADHRSAEDLIG